MTDINTAFCALMLRMIQQDLTGRELRDFRKNAGCLRSSSGGSNRYYVIEWPHMHGEMRPSTKESVRVGIVRTSKMFYWEGEADNAADAKQKALHDWLENHAPAVRARVQETGKMYPEEPDLKDRGL